MKIMLFIVLFCIIALSAYADNYAIVDSNGIVQNIIVWDGVSPYTLESGQTAVLAGTGAAIGGTYADGTFTPPAPQTPTPAQAATSALAAGLIVTSTATPLLNGTYSLNQVSQDNVNATTTYILVNGTFPGGGSTMPWIDQNGGAHMWPDIATFKAYATAFANYIAAVSLYAASNGAAGSLPSNQVNLP